MNNENIIVDTEEMQAFLFLEKLKEVVPQIESRLSVLGADEYTEIYDACVKYLVESDRGDMQIACTRVILLIHMKRVALEDVVWENYDIDKYVDVIWNFLKQWGGVLSHETPLENNWFALLVTNFNSTLAVLSLLMNMQTTHWTISRWVNSKVDYGMDYEEEEPVSEDGPVAEPLNMREELQRQLTVIEHEQHGADHPTFYFTNVAFHIWQRALIQDTFRSIHIIRTFLTPGAAPVPTDECRSFMVGMHFYVRLCLQNINNHKECMSFLMDNWLSELALPGLRGTSMTSTNVVNKSVWKQALPNEVAVLLTRIKDARLDALWMALHDDAPYDTCLRHAIFKQIIELTFSLYVRNRLLKVEMWMTGTAPDHQIFQHYGWWGIAGERVYANGWDAPAYVLYQWLYAERACMFHNAFIKMVCELRGDTLALPPPHTEGALIANVAVLPPYMITPQTMKKRKIIH